MHKHIIINHDLGLHLCIISRLSKINLARALEEMIKQKLELACHKKDS